jgi:hypothetical protein
MADHRARQALLRDAVWIDVCRETVLAANIMSADQYDDPETRRRLLSDFLEADLQAKAFSSCDVTASHFDRD